jgi:hypothetical protein
MLLLVGPIIYVWLLGKLSLISERIEKIEKMMKE